MKNMDGTNEKRYEPTIPPLTTEKALVIDRETELKPSNVTPRMAWDAIEKLELRQWVSEVQFEAKKQFGQYLEIQLNEGVMTTDIFESAMAMKKNIEGFTNMANDKSQKPDARIAAGLAASSAARSYKELIDSLARRIKESELRRDPSLRPKPKRLGPPIRGPIDIPSEPKDDPANNGK